MDVKKTIVFKKRFGRLHFFVSYSKKKEKKDPLLTLRGRHSVIYKLCTAALPAVLPLVTGTWRRDLEVCGLLDVGSSWSGVEGGDESRELSLQDEVVIPRSPATSFGLVLLLLL